MDAVEIYPRTSLVYEYGIRLNNAESIVAVIDAQARLAHDTYNRMVEICRTVFGDIMEFVGQQDAEIGCLQTRIDALSERYKEAKARDDRDALRAAATFRRASRQQWRERVWNVRNAHGKHIRDRFLSRVDIMKKESELYRLRTEAVAKGLYWATANEVMRRVRQAFDKSLNRLQSVRFQPWAAREQDTLVVQVNDRRGGLTLVELQDGSYPALHIAPLPPTNRRRSRSQSYTPFRIRIAPSPDGKGKRGGIDATGTAYWHRDLPTGARITYARLVRRRVASHWRSYLQLVVDVDEPVRTVQPAQARGIAGVDLNWHFDSEDAGRRIAAISDDGKSGRLIHLDPKHARDLDRVAAINEQRSKARDEIVGMLRGVDWSEAPPLLTPLAECLKRHPRAQDIAQSRLAGQIWNWKRECPDWKDAVLLAAEDWRKRDKRLWEAASHLRRKANFRRDKQYQGLARQLSADYELLLIDRPDLKRTAIVKNEHSGRHNELGGMARGGRHEVALSKLEHWITTKAAETGTRIVRVEGRTTWTCSACGAAVKKPDAEEVSSRSWVCPGCGVVHDRDINAACNVRRIADTKPAEIKNAIAVKEAQVQRKVALRAKRKEDRTEKLKGRHDAASAPVPRQTQGALAPGKHEPE
jgi:hypothetical protein